MQAAPAIPRAREFPDLPSMTEHQPPRMQRAMHVVGDGFAEITQRTPVDIDEAVPVILRECRPQLRGAH